MRFSEFRSTLQKIDFTLVGCVIAASLIGLVFITSTTMRLDNGMRYPVVQLIAILIGIFAMLIVVLLDYEYIASLWVVISATAFILLCAVAVLGTGLLETGSNAWLRMGLVTLQPSELAKLAFIVTFSKHIDAVKDKINHPLYVLSLIAHGMVPIGLVMLQPDFGTAVVFFIIFAAMLLFSGINWLYLIGGAIGTVGVAIFGWTNLISEYQKNRVITFVDISKATPAAKWHMEQSLIAIGSGKIFGKGLFQGSQVQSGMLYASHTDFIFAAIGEEGGLIWCVIVIALIFCIVAQAVAVAMEAKNLLGRLMCIGIVAMWFFHAFENIGMTMNIMPVTGIPLPFISYGGSAMVANYIAVGILLSVKMRPRTINF